MVEGMLAKQKSNYDVADSLEGTPEKGNFTFSSCPKKIEATYGRIDSGSKIASVVQTSCPNR